MSVGRTTTSVVQEDFGKSVGSRAVPSGFDPFLHAGFVQRSQSAAVLVQLRTTKSEGLSRRSGYNTKETHFWSVWRMIQRGSWRLKLRGMTFSYS